MQPVHQFPKILIPCQEYSLLLVCHIKNYSVGNTWRLFRDIHDNVAILAKLVNNLFVDSFVSKDIHAALSTIG